MEGIVAALYNVDSKVWIGLAIVLVVLAIIGIIKKAVKLGITLIVIGLVFGAGGTALNNLAENYNIKLVDGVIEVKLGEQEYSMSADNVDAIDVTTYKDGKSVVTLTLYGGIEKDIEVPTLITGVIEKIADTAGIPFSKTETGVNYPVGASE